MSQRPKVYASLLLSLAALCAGLPRAHAQQPQQQRAQQPQQEEVLRISTEIVQTDVMVLDKEGRAVPGLAREQFELLVDGQPQPLLFFDGVEAGGAKEAAKLAAARAGSAPAPVPAALAGAPSGRSFIFFVDDLHLSQASVQRARRLLDSFIERDMGPYDQAMIISPSGSVGFLQQLTDNKSVLKLAASRINYQPQTAPTGGPRSMTLAEARAIDRGQRDVFDYKVKEVMDDMGLNAKQYDLGQIAAGGETSLNNQPQPSGTPSQRYEIRGDGGTRSVLDANTGGGNIATRRQQAEAYVRNEARRVLMQGSAVGTALLSSLETVARGSASLPGRKLVFFISDGFAIDTRGDTADRVLRVIDAAARSGVAIYTLDSQGLTANFADASRDVFADTADLTGGHDAATTATSVAVAEGRETKEVLRALAEDTGGRAILNRNDLSAGLRQVIGETASYYVLAWKPSEAETGSRPKFKTIQVTVKGRPELRVLARKGFYTTPPPPVAEEKSAAKGDKGGKNDKAAAAEAKGMEADMRAALTAPFQRRQMGVASYAALAHEAPAGYKVTALADLSGYMAAGSDGKQTGEVDFAAVLLDDKGKSVSSVGQRVNAPSDEGGAKPFRITAKMPNALVPGLYQLRVVARDARTGRIGSSFQWIEVPEHRPGKMTLSSMLLAESASGDGAGASVQVDRRFRRASHMLVQFLVYNAAKTPAGQTDVAVTLKVMKGGQLLISSPPQPLAGADPAKLEYSAGFPLSNFPAGYYVLQVVVEDRAGKTTATQQLDFSIE